MDEKPKARRRGVGTKTECNIDAEKLKLYDELIATIPGVERRGGNNAKTTYNGTVFSFLSSKGTIGLCLPDQERAKFLEKYRGQFIEVNRSFRKGFVRVPDSLLKNTDELKVYFKMSYDFVKESKKP